MTSSSRNPLQFSLCLLLSTLPTTAMAATPEISVTATREETPQAEIAASIDGVSGAAIDQDKPAHPGEVLRQVPGAHVNVTNGEGHMTAIRQPLSTAPLYLFLEDGIPTRSTGFFNHNALYEVNLPQADGVEVMKGPGSALYGSDAIGGVVNVLTRPAPLEPEFDINLEAGEYGWRRMLLSGGNGYDDGGVRGDLNLTRSDGWRESTDYDRQSATLRWDHFLQNGGSLKTVLATSDIDQQTAGSSRLLEDDYQHDPQRNYTPISYREVQARRLSLAYEHEFADSLLSITPYVRSNYMELLPNWSLSYDPAVYETENDSFGTLLKYRKDFEPLRTRLIVGADVDVSPGEYFERSIAPTLDADGRTHTDYTLGNVIYDYDVEYRGVSPYVHVELSPLDKLRLNAGLRYDDMRYDYDNQLSVVTDPAAKHKRPADDTLRYDHFSPKFGATWAFSDTLNGFVAYRHAFRTPSEGQLFRQGSAENTIDLEPVKADSYEIGLRGGRDDGLQYEATVYRMVKKDDILSYRDPVTAATQAMNAGETLHRGIELGASAPLHDDLTLSVAWSYAKHTYEDWLARVGGSNIDFGGNEMESAPRTIASVRLDYAPAFLNGGQVGLEWERLGSYWMDQANTHRYDGHDLLHLRGSYPLDKQWEIYGRVINLTDERYATAALYKAAAFGKPEQFEYAPGQPRTLFIGVTYRYR